jgi:hypothetical protein
MEQKLLKDSFPANKRSRGMVMDHPQSSRKIGTYKFEEGNDGFIEILAEVLTTSYC